MSETQASDAPLVPTEVMSELMAQGSLDLAGKQVPVVTEVAFQRVAVDHDPVLVAFPRDAVPEVLAISVLFGTEVGDHDRDVRENLLELVGQPIDCVNHQHLEIVELGCVCHDTNGRDLATARRRNAGSAAADDAADGLHLEPVFFLQLPYLSIESNLAR